MNMFTAVHFLICTVTITVCASRPVDLISIDRRTPEREAESLEQARLLSEQFKEKVQDTDDHMWKPAETSAAQTDRLVG